MEAGGSSGLAIEERGPAGARTVVLLHGLAGDRALLAATLDETLAEAGLRRLYLDLPGHGASPGSPELASADALVALLGEVVAERGGHAPLVVGHAYGGYLALGLLRDLPLGGALLVGPVVEPDLGRRSCPPRRVRERATDLVFADEEERLTFEEAAVVQSPAVLAAYRALAMPASRSADRAFIEALRRRYAMSRPLLAGAPGADERLEVPLSLVCGRDDHWVGFEDAARLLRALPGASLHVLAGLGPLLPLEAPARLRALAIAWLARALR